MTTGFAVANHSYRNDVTERLESFSEIVFAGVVAQLTYEQIHS